MKNNKLVEEAKAFALLAHDGFFRLNKARDPYFIHLEEVARLVEQSGGSNEEIAAAWLHDTVEDTSATIAIIKERFGDMVAVIVDGLTDLPNMTKMPTFERKKLQAKRVRAKSDSVKRVKIADQISNVRSVVIDPPSKWSEQKCKDYVVGAKLIVEECKEASSFLYAEFQAVAK
ncbi:MAG: HD domain-containing protein [Patescibacteria group bacterium]